MADGRWLVVSEKRRSAEEEKPPAYQGFVHYIKQRIHVMKESAAKGISG